MTDSSPASPAGEGSRPKIDSTVAHPARIWNYWLGGKDYFAVDREVGDQTIQAYPHIVELARAQRAFLVRAVTYLAREAGIRQFLDIGTGLPAHRQQHASGRPGGRPAVAHRLRRQRPLGAGARPRTVGQRSGGRDRLHRRRLARPGQDPACRCADVGLHPADRDYDAGYRDLHN